MDRTPPAIPKRDAVADAILIAQAEEAFSRTVFDLRAKHLHYGYYLMMLSREAIPGLLRNENFGICINAKGHILYDPEYILKSNAQFLAGEIMHELMHYILRHISRCYNLLSLGCYDLPPSIAHTIFNFAGDIKINHVLKLDGINIGPDAMFTPVEQKDVDTVEAKIFRPDQKQTVTLYSVTEVNRKEVEAIFDELVKFYQKGKSWQPKKSDRSGKNPHPPNAEQRRAAEFCDIVDGMTVLHAWMNGFAGMSEEEIRELEAFTGGKFLQTEMLLRNQGRGRGSCALASELRALLEPKLRWDEELLAIIRSTLISEYTYLRPRRTSYHTGVIQKSARREGVSVILHYDTSGSMSDEDIIRAVTETIGLLQQRRNVKLTILVCDCILHHALEISPGISPETVTATIREAFRNKAGRGGTSHGPVVEWVREHVRPGEPAVLVSFTDGFSDISETYRKLPGTVRKVFVLSGPNDGKELAKIGKVIRI